MQRLRLVVCMMHTKFRHRNVYENGHLYYMKVMGYNIKIDLRAGPILRRYVLQIAIS